MNFSAVNDNATLGSATETRSANSTSDSNDGVEVNMKRRNLIFAEPNAGGWLYFLFIIQFVNNDFEIVYLLHGNVFLQVKLGQ